MSVHKNPQAQHVDPARQLTGPRLQVRSIEGMDGFLYRPTVGMELTVAW
jgi:hypothetical protein